MRLPTRQIVLEGCDLSGKTTFYSDFHKSTKFKYDIRDRGPLSRLVYSQMYDRDFSSEVSRSNSFLDDLNNVVVFLSPEWDLISGRFKQRGDDMHNDASLCETWRLFDSMSRNLSKHPSVIRVSETPDPRHIHDLVLGREQVTTSKIAEYAQLALESTGRNESLDMQFEIVVSPDDDPGPESLLVPGEEKYYAELRDSLVGKIRSEIDENKQASTSRRFVTTNDSCISYVRFIHRDFSDSVDLVCRSTNIPKNLKIDLDAIIHSAFQAQDQATGSRRNITIRVKLNCAHIIP